MNKRQLIALQCGILTTIVAALFPPHGYDRCTMITMPDAKAAESGVTPQRSTIKMPSWTYTGHSFILSHPPDDSVSADHFYKLVKWTASVTRIAPEIKIGWDLLAAEIAVIVLLTAGAIKSLGYKRNTPNVG